VKSVIIIAIAFVLFIPTSIFAQIIDFTTDEEIYHQFQTITFSGVVDVYPDISDIFIEYFNPEKKFTGSFTREINPDGTFIFKLQANPDVYTIDGEYTFKITYVNSVEKTINYQKFRDIAPFVDQSKNPCSYVDRYDNEPAYEKWFRDNYSEYISIYEAVGIQDKREICEPEMSEAEKQAREEIPNPCINIKRPQVDPRMQGDIGLNNPVYMEAVREAQYQYQQQIQLCYKEYQIQIDEKIKQLEMKSEPTEIICGTGTVEKNGQCVPERATMTTEMQQKSSNGGCLIATATFGSELAPQVQMLREIRDNSLLQTQSGQSFMQGFNQFYYSFSPTIADYERQNPVFKEVVKLTITPLLASLSLLNYVDLDSEESVLGYGIGIILMNVGMYFVAPVLVIHRIKKILNS